MFPLHISEDASKPMSDKKEAVIKCSSSRKQLMYDNSSTTGDSWAVSDNGNGLKCAASDFSNVRRSPRGHASSKCPRYDPYTGKPLETYPPTPKEPEDVHNSYGGIISDSNLVNLVPHNSARKSCKVQDENIIPTYLFEETKNATKTTPVKDEGENELKKKQNRFLTKK